MKVRDAIKQSLDTFMTERIEYADFVQDSFEMLPICFPEFIINMSGILCIVIHQTYENMSIENIIDVLTGKDFVYRLPLYLQVNTFIQWYLTQEAVMPYENGYEDVSWYDIENLLKSWNEFARERNSQ